MSDLQATTSRQATRRGGVMPVWFYTLSLIAAFAVGWLVGAKQMASHLTAKYKLWLRGKE